MEEDSFLSAGRMRKMHLVKICLIRISQMFGLFLLLCKTELALFLPFQVCLFMPSRPIEYMGLLYVYPPTDELQAVLTHVRFRAGLA